MIGLTSSATVAASAGVDLSSVSDADLVAEIGTVATALAINPPFTTASLVAELDTRGAGATVLADVTLCTAALLRAEAESRALAIDVPLVADLASLPTGISNGTAVDVTSPAIRVQRTGGAWVMTGALGGGPMAFASWDAMRTGTAAILGTVTIADGCAAIVGDRWVRFWHSTALYWVPPEAFDLFGAAATVTRVGAIAAAPTSSDDLEGFSVTTGGSGAATYPDDYLLLATTNDADTAYVAVTHGKDATWAAYIGLDVYTVTQGAATQNFGCCTVSYSDGANIRAVATRLTTGSDVVALINTSVTAYVSVSSQDTWRHIDIVRTTGGAWHLFVDGVAIVYQSTPSAQASGASSCAIGDSTGSADGTIRVRNGVLVVAK